MVPEDWEQPYTFNQIYVYGRMKMGNLWDWKNKSRFASWCKSHPPIFTAATGHGGVTITTSESGYEQDNKEIKLTPELGEKLLKGYYYNTGESLNAADFLDCPPTPNTSHVMETEDFPHELFENPSNTF